MAYEDIFPKESGVMKNMKYNTISVFDLLTDSYIFTRA